MNNLRVLLILKSFICFVLSSNISFSKSHFYTMFKPYVVRYDLPNAYEEADLLPMIRLISTRFSNIITGPFGLAQRLPSMELIPIAIANFNKLQNSTLTVIINYKLENAREIEGKNITPFDIALELAEKANAIHNGTVHTLQLWFGDSSYEPIVEQLKAARTKLKSGSLEDKYRLGIGFGTDYCETGNQLSDTTISILNYLDTVFYNYYPKNQAEFDLGAEKALQIYLKHFKFCKEKVDKLGLGIRVGIAGDWPDTDHNGKQNYSELVTFWEKMNEFVIATNTNAIGYEAFDDPNLSPEGWWKLRNGYYRTSEDYVFVEKRELALEQKDGQSNILNPDLSLAGISTFSVIVISSVLVAVIIGVIIFLARRIIRKEVKNQVGKLSKDDIKQFFDGCENSDESSIQYQTSYSAKYDGAKYELKTDTFLIDEESILGKGNFGVVYKASVKLDEGEVKAAVKMVKKLCPSSALKGLLSEIKVLSHLGEHKNIVCLIGAYTKDLGKGKILVFTELCNCGSLESHLGGMAQSICETEETEEKVVSKLLLKWSRDIVDGMEFIISKQVVHADLATRNVLLDDKLNAKISDFGLSRRLYEYSSYVKKSQEPLPWRWMSPESLRRLEFTEKSDVWAFGVTLWEIYSLGSLPYEGLSWSTDFSSKLSKGLRLEEPEYNCCGMYGTMLKCWDLSPEKRPNFLDLKEMLAKQSYSSRTSLSSEVPQLEETVSSYTILEDLNEIN